MASTIQRGISAVTTFIGRPKHRYETVDTQGDGDLDGDLDGDIPIERRPKEPQRNHRRRDLVLFTLSFLFIGLSAYWIIEYTKTDDASTGCDNVSDGYRCRQEMSRFWGQYSPYFAVNSEISADLPDQCQITFAQVLSRHGARVPTASKSEKYREMISHIKATTQGYFARFRFLQTYEYKLGADNLTVFGEQEMVNSGMKYYQRYQTLARDHVPFVRSAGQERVVVSAQKWAEGFHAARAVDKPTAAPDAYPYNIVVMDEGPQLNNTLSHDSCTNFETSFADEAQKIWAEIFTARIRTKINRSLTGAELTTEQVIYLMDLCPFETVANPEGKVSPICDLFTPAQWKDYDYYQSLGKYYGFGNGNPLGATQGVGFVNELIARLTNRPVEDQTNTNSTLDSSDDTFPVDGNTRLFADFSHDNDMSEIFAALGLYNATEPLDETKRVPTKDTGGFAASWTVPFGARAYFEKLSCAGQDEEYVRVLVNDRVLPLETCGGDRLGRCTLSRFVDSLSFARGGGHWDKCFT